MANRGKDHFQVRLGRQDGYECGRNGISHRFLEWLEAAFLIDGKTIHIAK